MKLKTSLSLFVASVVFVSTASAICAGAAEVQGSKTICGLSWNYTSAPSARASARNAVREEGGFRPRIVFVSLRRGYAGLAAALNRRNRLITAYVVGYPSAKGARLAARAKARLIGGNRAVSVVAGNNTTNKRQHHKKTRFLNLPKTAKDAVG